MRFLILFLVFSCLANGNEKIWFLHIPRTAGITFRDWLEEHFSYNQYDRFYIGADSVSLTGNPILNKNLVSWHVYFYEIKGESSDRQLVTLVRNPVDRVLSDYRYLTFTHESKDPLSKKRHLLPRDSDPLQSASNIACLALSQLNPKDLSISIEEHLASAKNTLEEKIFFLGITERLKESMELLAKKLGWTPPEMVSFNNTTEDFYKEYPSDLIRGIEERNWADIELYKYALDLYEKQKETILSSSGRVISSEYFRQSINYTFDLPLNGSGWCNREKEGSELFRWMGYPEKALINLPVQKGPAYVMQVEMKFSDRAAEKMLEICVNGHRASYKWVEQKVSGRHGTFNKRRSLWTTLSIEIPAKWITSNKATSIEFAVKNSSRPSRKEFYRGRCAVKKISVHRVR